MVRFQSPFFEGKEIVMSIFGAIKDAIFGKAKTSTVPRPSTVPGQAPPAQTARPAAVQAVDVDATLADVAAKKGQPLNYKTSIVDLMKVLDLDSSLTNRKELAKEARLYRRHRWQRGDEYLAPPRGDEKARRERR